MIHQEISGLWDGEGRSEQYRRFDLAKLVHLRRPHQLPESVAHEYRTRDLFTKQIARVRQDGGHARANVITTNNGRVSDAHACNVGDRIVRASGKYPDL